MKRRLIHGSVVLAKAVLIAWALMYLTEYFGWHLASEAGGGVVASAHRTSRYAGLIAEG